MSILLKYFNLESKADFNEYLSIWRSGTSRRPHDHPQFILLMKADNQRPCVIVYFEGGQPKIIYPFYLLNISKVIDVGVSGVGAKHMTSVYGYGGPTLLNHDKVDFEKFEQLLSAYIVESNIISEFVRTDLFSEYKPPRNVESHKQQDNVVIDLRKSHEELWSSYKHSVRKNIKRAESSGLEVVFDFDGKMIDEFVRVYHSTMLRTGAKQYFMIPLEAFEELNLYFDKDKIGFYVHVLMNDKVIATELVLRSPQYLYSFLGGSDMEYSDLRPSDLLKHRVNSWSIENGVNGYVLGGGVTPYDGIYKFKLAFDQNGARPFFIQRIVHNHDAYHEMVLARKAEAQKLGLCWELNPDFFPSYLS